MEFNATFLVSAISFIVFVFLMNKIFYEPIEKIILQREKLVEDTLNDAKISKETASKLLQERETKLNKAHEDGKKIISDSVQKANADSSALILQTKSNSLNTIETKKEELSQESNEAQKQLEDQVETIAEQITSKILG